MTLASKYTVYWAMFILCLLFTLQSTDIRAQDGAGVAPSCNKKDGITYEDKLTNYWSGNCYLNQASYRRLSEAVKADLQPTAVWSKRADVTLQAASTVYALSEELSADLTGTSKTLLASLREQTSLSIKELKAWEPKSQYIKSAGNWGKSAWTPNERDNESWKFVKDALRESGCFDSEKSDNCDGVYEDVLSASGLSFAMRDVEWYYREPATDDRLLDIKLNVERWDAYLTEMQFQYPWELMLNYCYDNPRLKRRPIKFSRWQCFVPVWGSLAVRKHLQQWPDEGFVKPPNKRWIFLHPEAGMVYAPDQTSGDRFAPALTFQWIGRFFNGYNGKTGRISKAWGVSLASVVADLPDSSNHGIGLMGHYRKFSLAVTKHGGDTVYTVNLNLFDLFQGGESSSSASYKGVYDRLTEDN